MLFLQAVVHPFLTAFSSHGIMYAKLHHVLNQQTLAAREPQMKRLHYHGLKTVQPVSGKLNMALQALNMEMVK